MAPLFHRAAIKNRCTSETQRYCTRMIIITARHSYATAVLGVIILSVCQSVRLSHACFVANPKNLLAYFYTTFSLQQTYSRKWALQVGIN